MNWITLGGVHYNLDHVQGFSWCDGELGIFVANRDTDVLSDPDRRWYHKLCARVSLPPVEQEEEK